MTISNVQFETEHNEATDDIIVGDVIVDTTTELEFLESVARSQEID